MLGKVQRSLCENT
uniref:Uncharacterized protein n=1 Tax=Anguilla anguilla TaxID=7936 RepID=A0A0E9VB36_ANGAN